MHSLRNRLVLIFFAVTFVAIAALYRYVAPGLQNRLLDEKMSALSGAAARYSPGIAVELGTRAPRAVLQRMVDRAALESHDRVSLLAVNNVSGQPQISSLVDSNAGLLYFPVAYEAVQRVHPVSGTELSGT